MGKKYTIRQGFTFVMPDRTVKAGGDIFELEDDVYNGHAHKLELVAADSKKAAGSKKADAPDTAVEGKQPADSQPSDQPDQP